jgi:hypothetical protein
MSEGKKGGKEDVIKDSMLKIVRGSEAVAAQAVDSAASVLKLGLEKADDLSAKAGDILLNTARRTINAGVIVGNDVREATEKMVKETIKTASEIGDDLKEAAVSATKKNVPAVKPKEEAKSE